ncbi:hypothetical protein [Amycolatopsis sp. H20-H5]|uniref:hypothetical protein n=1 Tax=Amycolatopsis sp. H20-H5 TaxID=3046309 RepID=UPI002DBB4611|nr:hypothetical protein [Amycolatopsis sp. H20-H5]MEC3980776.1 hypothetical protein [Amycolatopsis sp. H20-H5]
MSGGERGDSPGYEDKEALSGFGGYQPSDSPRFESSQGFGVAKTPDYQQPRPPRRKRPMSRSARRLVLTLGATVVVVGGSLLFGTARHHPPRTATPRPPTTYTPAPQVVVPAVVSGWQSVAGKDGVYAYDVPPNWAPHPGAVHGWDRTPAVPGIVLSASAFLGESFCAAAPGSRLGGAGVTTVPLGDPAAAAEQAVTNLGVSAYSPDDGPLSEVTVEPAQAAEVSFGGGEKAAASIVLAEVTPSATGACVSRRALVGAIALRPADPANPKSAVLVVYSDQGNPGATSREQVLQILHSYRAVPAAQRTTVTPPPTTR